MANTDRLLASASLVVSSLMLITLWLGGIFSLRDRISRLEGLFEGHLDRPCPTAVAAVGGNDG